MSSLIRYFELIIERQDDWENERKKKKKKSFTLTVFYS